MDRNSSGKSRNRSHIRSGRSRSSMASRSKSISHHKLREVQVNSPRSWLWDPDEITGMGHTRVLERVVLPDETLEYCSKKHQNPDDIERTNDTIACLMLDCFTTTTELYRDFVRYNVIWGDLYNHPENYENEGYPSEKKYPWKKTKTKKDGTKETKVMILKVGDYVDKILEFFLKKTEDPRLFPKNESTPFPSNFRKNARMLNTLLFRVHAIIYVNEHKSVHTLAKRFKDSFRFLLYYSWVWDLLDDQETDCVLEITLRMRKEFMTDVDTLFIEDSGEVQEVVEDE